MSSSDFHNVLSEPPLWALNAKSYAESFQIFMQAFLKSMRQNPDVAPEGKEPPKQNKL